MRAGLGGGLAEAYGGLAQAYDHTADIIFFLHRYILYIYNGCSVNMGARASVLVQVSGTFACGWGGIGTWRRAWREAA